MAVLTLLFNIAPNEGGLLTCSLWFLFGIGVVEEMVSFQEHESRFMQTVAKGKGVKLEYICSCFIRSWPHYRWAGLLAANYPLALELWPMDCWR